MFTGIIACTAEVLGLQPTATGYRLQLDTSGLAGPIRAGDSIAVSGVCLTAVDPTTTSCHFDVVPETLRRTALSELRCADVVNLEQAMPAGGRFDGHFVQGHIDAVATVARVDAGSSEHVAWFDHAQEIAALIVPKGSVAIDGVSLTVAEVAARSFSVALIPTTLQRTTLASLRPGRRVNIETDLVARAVAHQLGLCGRGRGDLSDLLQRQGFA